VLVGVAYILTEGDAMMRTVAGVILGLVVFIVGISLLNQLTMSLRPEWIVAGTGGFAPTHAFAQWVGIAENVLAALVAGGIAAWVARPDTRQGALGIALVLLLLLVGAGIVGVQGGHWLVWRALAQALLVPVAAYAGGVAIHRAGRSVDA
jgi:hypothetical protein